MLFLHTMGLWRSEGGWFSATAATLRPGLAESCEHSLIVGCDLFRRSARTGVSFPPVLAILTRS